MDVVKRLKERLEVGCEKISFKYIGVKIRQEKKKVMMT